MTRKCGDCQLCCTLLPISEIGKAANQRCNYQKFGKGCTIYDRRPKSCQSWSCMWLIDNAPTQRPDRAHYVIDVTGTHVALLNEVTGAIEHAPAAQVWCDPKYPDAHRDPALREYLMLLNTRGLTLVRYNEREGITLIPPHGARTTWREVPGEFVEDLPAENEGAGN